jgi:hypothetical protein
VLPAQENRYDRRREDNRLRLVEESDRQQEIRIALIEQRLDAIIEGQVRISNTFKLAVGTFLTVGASVFSALLASGAIK